MATKREGELKSSFREEFKRLYPKYVILQSNTAGAPDRSISGHGRTTWWEMKHATPRFDSPGIQELVCSRLEIASFCRYILWWDVGSDLRTLIVRPRDILAWNGKDPIVTEAWCLGHDHWWLAHYIDKVHRSGGCDVAEH